MLKFPESRSVWHFVITVTLIKYCLFVLLMAQQPREVQHLFNIMASRPHSDTPHTLGLLWASDQPEGQTSTWQHTTLTTDRHPRPPVGLEPTIPAIERPQTHALDRAATGIGQVSYIAWLKRKTYSRLTFCAWQYSRQKALPPLPKRLYKHPHTIKHQSI